MCESAEYLLAWCFLLHSHLFDMQHGYFQKKGDPGIKGKSKVKIFASMLLYADMQHDHILKKLILYKPM